MTLGAMVAQQFRPCKAGLPTYAPVKDEYIFRSRINAYSTQWFQNLKI
jgi:hypothetical protein